MTGIAMLYIIITAMVFLAALAMIATWRTRSRVTVCPETGKPVHVAVDPGQAAKAVFTGKHLEVVACERWPERAGCDRACETRMHA